MQYLKSITAIMLCSFVLTSCADDNPNVSDDGPVDEDTGIVEATNEDLDIDASITEDNVYMEDMTIAEIVMESEKFTILEDALVSTGMSEMFMSGAYTVIAPIDDAWEEILDEYDYEAWFVEHEVPLTTILEYHVIAEPVTAADLADGFIYGSVLGSPLNFDVEEDGEININDHEVEYVIHASNGVIYVVNEVFMPEDISNDLFE